MVSHHKRSETATFTRPNQSVHAVRSVPPKESFWREEFNYEISIPSVLSNSQLCGHDEACWANKMGSADCAIRHGKALNHVSQPLY